MNAQQLFKITEVYPIYYCEGGTLCEHSTGERSSFNWKGSFNWLEDFSLAQQELCHNGFWKMLISGITVFLKGMILLPLWIFSGRPITVSCAYTGRVAIAYRLGAVMTAKDNPSNKYVNLYVSIYECESTGKRHHHTVNIIGISRWNVLCSLFLNENSHQRLRDYPK